MVLTSLLNRSSRSPRDGASWLSSFSWVRGAASCPWLLLMLVSWMMVKMRLSITKHWVQTNAFMSVYLLVVGG